MHRSIFLSSLSSLPHSSNAGVIPGQADVVHRECGGPLATPGSWWPPLAGGMHPSRLLYCWANPYNQGGAPERRPFISHRYLSPPPPPRPPILHAITLLWSELTERASIKKQQQQQTH